MKKLILGGLAALAIGLGLGVAAPAQADESVYLQVVQQFDSYLYNKYGSTRLLQEGYRVCDAVQQGYSFDQVISMIQSDLSASPSGAGGIYGAATSGLGC